ncbi:hypothetical protein BDD12DRAFT_885683 [Trichophaea hybrida]|nr:hypothetical protein BDD12DRAFT_885683 [Trichophaea hybrida]
MARGYFTKEEEVAKQFIEAIEARTVGASLRQIVKAIRTSSINNRRLSDTYTEGELATIRTALGRWMDKQAIEIAFCFLRKDGEWLPIISKNWILEVKAEVVEAMEEWMAGELQNLLEVTIITASGSHKTLNPYTDPSYFYAIRGGGGNAWCVITSATYKTHPSPTHIRVGLLQFNVTTLRLILQTSLALLPDVTNAGYTGYGFVDVTGLSAIFIQPNGTNEAFSDTFAPFYNLTSPGGVRDPNIATNVIDSTRLLTSDLIRNRNKELVDLVLEYPDSVGKVDATKRGNTAVHLI